MHILTSAYSLDLSGVPTYTLTLFHELRRRGHEVSVYSPIGGKLATEMGAVPQTALLETPDVILAQHWKCALALRTRFPKVPMLFSSHGVATDEEEPPWTNLPRYIAINEDVAAKLFSLDIPSSKIGIVRDFIDTERFLPVRPVANVCTKVMFLSNFRRGNTFHEVEEACRLVGVKLMTVGAPYGRSNEVEKKMNEADLVISMARGILESMSCGRPVISFGLGSGDGYLTRDLYFESRKRNFSGEKCLYRFNAESLALEIIKFNSKDGQVNRDLILEHHDHVRGVDQILQNIEMVL